jgi:hypothetical protein
VKHSFKARPVVGFLFAENELIIDSDFEAANIREKHVFLSNRVIVLVLLLLDGKQKTRNFISSDDRRILLEDFFNKVFH